MLVDEISFDFIVANCSVAGDCLIWNGNIGKEGYPQMADPKIWREEGRQKQVRLHRWMYEDQVGELRKGQQVRQTCGNKLCVSPKHLETSIPRAGRDPVGEGGRYKGRQKRDDDLERCANGHDWTIETLYIDSKGRRICRICQSASYFRSKGMDPSAHEWKRRKSWEETPQCVNGHSFEEYGWYFNGEARVCRKCFAEKERARWLRTLYGLTPADFESMLVKQAFSCAICNRGFDPDVRELAPCVDHSHSTGRVRALLCSACNIGLGHFKDDPERLKAALLYLKNYEEPRVDSD
ncbi:endonuclease domain-containing protein [Nonomuraea wenchangensis]|uniref:endonuclease domain-containing protein n=1 Tax=Nonomuraea wenchangensis TaxID=568860 RepID=UPI0038514FE5